MGSPGVRWETGDACERGVALLQSCDLKAPADPLSLLRRGRAGVAVPQGVSVASSTIEQIKAQLDIAEVIGAHVPLKRSGRSFKGLCPFHAEKTPSFYVFPETGTWKCFGCGEGGDVFSFVQRQANLEFGEALRLLAARAGVALPERERSAPEARAREERLLSALAAAATYFRAALTGAAGALARAYLEERGVNAETIERFGLGYAPHRGLLEFLRERGYTLEEAIDVGLAGRREDGTPYEMFRHRLMFPIRDPAGTTVSFGGRVLGDGQPKYLNGPQTAVFDKGGCLFALDLARPAIRRSGQAVIVEGYLDAVIAHQYGFTNVVATLGTALTERHLDLLGRRTSEILLALDADAAGESATYRGIGVILRAPSDAFVPVPQPGATGRVRYQAVRRTQAKILTLPRGLDPDELIRRDPAEWARLVQTATPVVDFVLNRLGERHDLSTAAGKRAAVDEAMEVLRDLADPIEREHYLQRLASLVDLDEVGLRQVLYRAQPRRRGTPAAVQAVEQAPAGDAAAPPTAEVYALALHVLGDGSNPILREDDLASPEGRALYRLLSAEVGRERGPAALAGLEERIDSALRPGVRAVASWTARLESLEPQQRERELEVAALKLRQQRLRIRHREILALLESATPEEQAAPRAMLAELAAQLRATETALAKRNGIGSLVWRSRQRGEVLRD